MQDQVHRGTRLKKPWGYEMIWAHTDRYVGKILHINVGESLSLQYHRVKDEAIHLLHGAMELEVQEATERKVLRLKPGDCFHITPGVTHRMAALEDCDVLEASTPELEDVVRLEDRYGRVRAK
ncbi:MAG: cupin domain-containing protein [Candidatus Binatia bacterium]